MEKLSITLNPRVPEKQRAAVAKKLEGVTDVESVELQDGICIVTPSPEADVALVRERIIRIGTGLFIVDKK